MNLLPNLSKVPIRFSLIVILASPLAYYLLAIRPVDSLTMDDISPGNLINRAVAQVAPPPPPPLPVPEAPPVGRYDEPQVQPVRCPPQVAYREPVPVPQRVERVARRQGTRTYWAGNQRVLRDSRAIALLNMAPGTKRSTIIDRFGLGTWDGDSFVMETGDGLIRLNFSASSRLSSDELTWAGFVQ